jgi:predicted transcriptional regulator
MRVIVISLLKNNMNKQQLKKQLKENIEILDNLIIELSIFELLKDNQASDIFGEVRHVLYEQKEKLEEINI